jgi:hypothetical protein
VAVHAAVGVCGWQELLGNVGRDAVVGVHDVRERARADLV